MDIIVRWFGIIFILLMVWSLYMTKYFPKRLERILRRVILFMPFILPLSGFGLDIFSLYLSTLSGNEGYGYFPIMTFYGFILMMLSSPIVIMINIIQGFLAKRKKK